MFAEVGAQGAKTALRAPTSRNSGAADTVRLRGARVYYPHLRSAVGGSGLLGGEEASWREDWGSATQDLLHWRLDAESLCCSTG